jgi:hypothetical protein
VESYIVVGSKDDEKEQEEVPASETKHKGEIVEEEAKLEE